MKTAFMVSVITLFIIHGMTELQASGSEQSPKPDQVMSLIEQAEMARQSSSQAGAEWLRTGELIEEAHRHAEDGDWQRAEAAARLALRQSELALEQAARESSAWKDRVLR